MFQQFQGHLEGFRLAIAPGSFVDPDGVLWNTDDSARITADVLEAVGLAQSSVKRLAVDFTAADYVDAGTFQVAFKEILLDLPDLAAFVTGAWAARPLSSSSQPQVAIYTVGEGVSGLPWRPLALFQPGGAVVPLAEPLESNLADAYVPTFSALPAWIYPAGRSSPALGVFSWTTGVTPDLALTAFVEVAFNRQLPASPPFPR